MNVICCQVEFTLTGRTTNKEESWGHLSHCREGKGRKLRWVLDPACLGHSSLRIREPEPTDCCSLLTKLQSHLLQQFKLPGKLIKPAVLILSKREFWSDGGSSLPPGVKLSPAGEGLEVLKVFSGNFPQALGNCPAGVSSELSSTIHWQQSERMGSDMNASKYLP